MRHLYCYLILSALTVLSVSCGHSGSQADAYSETIFWEDVVYASTEGPEEYSDSQLISPEENEVTDESVSCTDQDTMPAGTRRPIELRQIGRLQEIFNDSNHYQLAHARRLGIEPISDIATYYTTRRPLVKIETNPDFVVDQLHHSYPYLVPEAAALLHDIGKNFQDSLASRDGGKYRIIVTSVLRTPVTVKRLRRVNGNATQESTHQYATTFDITYTRFNPAEGRDINSQEELKNILGEVLYDLRQQGRCMVKYERKSPCYHITVVK